MSATSVPPAFDRLTREASESAGETRRFLFLGTASEYFKIWIVNLFLTILTFGIYSAWAKVRRLRYFYGLTLLDNANFEYHARPKQILIGRIIVVAALIFYNILVEIAPFWALALLVPYGIALPWLINKSFAFNARMTSYRNVRLGFEGSYGRAFLIYVLLPALPIALGAASYFAASSLFTAPEAITVGDQEFTLPFIEALIAAVAVGLVSYLIVTPLISRYSSNYIGSNMSYGTARFNTSANATPFYANLGFCLALVLVPGLLLAGLGYLVTSSGGSGIGLLQIASFLFYVWVISIFFVYRAGVRNIAFNATSLDGRHQMVSNVPRLGYAWVLVTNLVVTILSLGLMRAWAAVRTWRYLADHTAVVADGDFDDFVAGMEKEGNVAAAEYFDIEGIDFGL